MIYGLDAFTSWHIESRIAEAGHQARRDADNAAGRASAYADRRMNELQDRLGQGMAEVRMDMLGGFETLATGLNANGVMLKDGLLQIDRNQHATNDALGSMKMTFGVISDNIREGFNQVIDRLESIEDTLQRIEKGIVNPEETRAFERYRRARMLLDHGRVDGAMENLDAAIHNDGGPILGHIPEIRTLRGLIRLGLYDGKKYNFLNPALALEDLEEARVFASSSAVPMLLEKAAFAQCLLKDYTASLNSYIELGDRLKRDGASVSENNNITFLKARCMLQMGRNAKALQLFEHLFRTDWTYSLRAAADPVCQEHAKLFTALTDKFRLEKLKACRKAIHNRSKISASRTIGKFREFETELFRVATKFQDPFKRILEQDPELKKVDFKGVYEGQEATYKLERYYKSSLAEIIELNNSLKHAQDDLQDDNISTLQMKQAMQAILDEMRTRQKAARIALKYAKRVANHYTARDRTTVPEACKITFKSRTPKMPVETFMPEEPQGLFAKRRYRKEINAIREEAERRAEEAWDEARDRSLKANAEAMKDVCCQVAPAIFDQAMKLNAYLEKYRDLVERHEVQIVEVERALDNIT